MSLTGGQSESAISQSVGSGLSSISSVTEGLLVFINDVHALGLRTAQGMLLTASFYWDRDEESRAWAQRYFERMNEMPNMVQAGVYSATTHYLRAVQAAVTDETNAVMEKMQSTRINDFFVKNGKIREDGRM
jgi:branched-chain amino acid transport system substrate-binding protein